MTDTHTECKTHSRSRGIKGRVALHLNLRFSQPGVTLELMSDCAIGAMKMLRNSTTTQVVGNRHGTAHAVRTLSGPAASAGRTQTLNCFSPFPAEIRP